MHAFKITASNSATLSKQVDRFNALPDIESFEHRKCFCNWGREGKRGTWFVHGTYGKNAKTGCSFSDVVDYVQSDIDVTIKMVNTADI